MGGSSPHTDDTDSVDTGEGRACWDVDSGWPECAHLAGSPEGFGPGERMPDWTLVDQRGESLSMHRLASMVVVVDVSAGWCGPCNQAAGVAEEWYQEHRDDGVMMVHLMTEDYRNQPADTAFAAEWADEYGLTFPVGTEDEGVVDALYDEGLIGGIPTYLVYDRELRLQAVWTGYSAELLDEAVEQLQ
ncbi:MAG: TlpA family protein disulfide reductase [Proteobacteria bacterium]|nr:TlpA family protein disulfide reductase [Pseudomonadota bacterium]MCP4915802.1 TlpA family protein disulfide reductase [Pseudomonadota bacterium]